MYFTKKIISLISIILIALLLNYCAFYKKIDVPVKEVEQIKNKAIMLHWDNTDAPDMYLLRVQLGNGKIQGLVQTDSRYWKSKKNRIHLYLDSSVAVPDSLPSEITIPLASITKIEAYDVDTAVTVIYALGAIAISTFVTYMIIMIVITLIEGIEKVELKESCPFIYTYNGESYEFIGEIYSGAIFPQLERHDYLLLPSIKSVDNEYWIKMSNKVHEIQYTNIAELLVFDHSPGSDVLVDKYGTPHILTNPQSPRSAINYKGDTVLNSISEVDSINYLSTVIDRDEDIFDGIILNFERPQNIDSAKLVIRAKNSFWLDYVAGQFYNLFGEKYNNWYEKQKTVPENDLRRRSLDRGIPLLIYLEKDGEWIFEDYYHIIGSMAEKNDIISLDITDIEEEEINVKLEFGCLFWEIDYVAMDFSPDIPITEKTITLKSALDQNDQDVSQLLMNNDDKYQVMYNVGDDVTLKFPAPEIMDNKTRTVILHSKGHYQVIRNPMGLPDISYLKTFREPSKFVEYSRDKYLDLYQKIMN